ncbi:MAG: hypothetical protein Q8T13_07280 [Acidobacteriota bacterium]|nr:hypothetical protein [Acidobacteriota bacterium]
MTHRHFRTLSVVFVITLLLANATACSGPESRSHAPTAPSSTAPAAASASGAAGSSAPAGVIPEPGGSRLPSEVSGPTAVSFPPRTEALFFRTALEAKYRDGLRRSSVLTYVDQEGTVVWVQEYLRYRVNLCSHVDAITRVFQQIEGFGVQPVCGSTNTATFPSRQQPLDFMVQLEAKYRDGLRRPSAPTFVDVEGNVIWVQEYFRYRVSGCDHSTSQQKVFDQIDGRGVAANCTPVAPPPAPTPAPSPGGGVFTLSVSISQCSCVVGAIQVRANGAVLGQMACPQTQSFSVSSGASVTICDNTGCWGSAFTMTGNRSVNLNCGSAATSSQGDGPFVWLGGEGDGQRILVKSR